MNRQDIVTGAEAYIENSAENYISGEIALSKDVIGMRIFECPIFAFGDSKDPLFDDLKRDAAIGGHFMLPEEWLSRSQTVISFFLPFSSAVKESNRMEKVYPSHGWLHARIEGQILLNSLCLYLQESFKEAGHESVIPSLDKRFWSRSVLDRDLHHPEVEFTSNWSERHVAYVCGLGTFGLSKGLITSKGVAGRFGSLITDLKLESDKRAYDSVYGYCSQCGQCAINCPVKAISIENGKSHKPCSDFLDCISLRYKPRYGCGKCQTGVPCESRIPL